MSGHSKWAKIKRQKGANDIKKGNVFTKLSQDITFAVREGGGGDPDSNFILRLAMEKAKQSNMPKDNIERAIQKGLGKSESGQDLESIEYEIVGERGVALILDCQTDNKQRTVSSVRSIASKHGFSLGSGSASWQFNQKGSILIEPYKKEKPKVFKEGTDFIFSPVDGDKIVLEIMEIDGVEDVNTIAYEEDPDEKDVIEVITEKDKLTRISKYIDEIMMLKLLKVRIIRIPHIKIDISEDRKVKIQALIDELEENSDIESVWHNVNL